MHFPSCVDLVKDAVMHTRGRLRTRKINYPLRVYLFLFNFGSIQWTPSLLLYARGNVNSLEHGVWETSWGVIARSLGTLVTTRSDDAGLVLPSRVASLQVVLVSVVATKIKEAASSTSSGSARTCCCAHPWTWATDRACSSTALVDHRVARCRGRQGFCRTEPDAVIPAH